MSGVVFSEIQREDFLVAGDPGIELAVREVRKATSPGDAVPVLLIHGARVPGVASFDLPVPGGSLAAALARDGHRVFILDVRGYGGSTRHGQDGAGDAAPLVRSSDVVRDIDAVVKTVSARTGSRSVALLGWATGGHWAGMYTSQHPSQVSHLVIYNSLYGAHAGHDALGPGSPSANPKNPTEFDVDKFGAFWLSTADSLTPSWDKSIPIADKAAWRDPAVLHAYQAAALASDPTSSSRTPASFRAPSGAMADSFELASGHKLWSAETITAHVLLVRSGADFWSRPEDVTTLHRDLTAAASVSVVTLPHATHYVHLDRAERGRAAFLTEVTQFLAQPTPRR